MTTGLWIALATLVALVGIWQAKVAIGQGLRPQQAELPPPLKTRFAVRPPAKVFTGSWVEDYIALGNKGLTDREIGWIIEDFRNTGLALVNFTDRTTDEEIMVYRTAQQRWYHGALKDGLRLTADQSSEAAQKLDEILRKVSAEFWKDRQTVSATRSIGFDSRFDYLLSHAWLFLAYDPESPSEFRFMPWEICSLTTEQSQITRRKAFEQLHAASPIPSSENSATPELILKSKTPFDDTLELPYQFALVDAIFPYLKSQSFLSDDASDDLLENIRRLHPAQFKLMLLFHPEVAQEIQTALDLQNP